MIYYECYYISESKYFNNSLNSHFKIWILNSDYNCFSTYYTLH